MFDHIITSIKRFGSFSETELSEVINRLKVLNLAKESALIKEGEVCRDFYFVNSGGFRQYEIQDDGTESILNLYVENDWLFDYKSFVTQKASETVTRATEDSEVFKLSGYDFHDLVKSSDSFFRMGRIFEQAIQNQDYQHNRMTPEEKYVLLMANKPQIIQKFPLKYIASYLGMTPETLSRVRRKMIS